MGNNCCNSERNYVGYGFVSDAEYSKPTLEQEEAVADYYSEDPPVPVILKRVNEWKEAPKTTSKNEPPDKKTLPSNSTSESMKNVPIPVPNPNVPIPGIPFNFEKKAGDRRVSFSGPEKANSTISSTMFKNNKNYTRDQIEPVPDVLARADKAIEESDKVIEATKKRIRKRKKEPHKPKKGTSKIDGKEPHKPTKGTSKKDGKEVDKKKKPIKGKKDSPKTTKGTSKTNPKDSSKKTTPTANESTPNDPTPVPVPGMFRYFNF